MNTQEMRQLAADATSLMAHAAAMASMSTSKRTKSGHQYQLRILSPLVGWLWQTHQTLQGAAYGNNNGINERLPMLLKMLEAVCKWPPHFACEVATASHPFPVLYALAQKSSGLEGDTLRKLSVKLSRFASSSGQYVGNFLSNLETFVSRADMESQPRERDGNRWSEEPPCGLIESPDEYPDIVNEILHATLLQHSHCTCPSNGDSSKFQEHWARLRLGEKPLVTETHVAFDILFSAAPASSNVNETLWQHLRFRIPKPAKPNTAPCVTREGGVVSGEPSFTQDEEHKVIELGTFCSLLGRRLGSVCIRLEIVDGKLHQLFDAEKPDHGLLKGQSVPLSKLLECRRLPTKSKTLLAYMLARSVWQYYDSDFMRAPWTTDSIHFMREIQRRNLPKIEIKSANPYFAFSPLTSEQSELAEYYSGYSVLHRYPRVLALAVLLVDICQKEAGIVRKGESFEEQMNNDFMRCCEIINSGTWPDLDFRNGEAIRIYKDAVQRCLDPTLFNIPDSLNIPSKDAIKKRRNALYTYVVLPLANLCADAGIIHEPDQIDQMTHSEPIVQPLNAPPPSLLSSSNKRICSSASWLESLMGSCLSDLVMKQFRANVSLPRIRIAILDTGYDAKSHFFTAASRMRRLVGWKDFVDGQEWPVDHDGHGSHALSLIMKLAPAADVCVARIAENSRDLRDRASSIAEAIEWATDCDGANADIVSMSFGFPEEPFVDRRAVISNAIHKAIHRRNDQVLFFAAAANDGGNQREAFPARHNNVFSIRATDHQGAFQQSNPAADALETHIFGTLGTEVPGVWLSTREDEACRTGTSIATPIVAGIAATILGYARLGISSNKFDEGAHMERLWTKRGMSLVLMKLSREMSHRHFYVYPQEFYREVHEKQRDALLLEAIRLF